MKKLFFLAALPLFLSACKQPEPPASVTDPTVPGAASGRAAAELPKGLALDVPYIVLGDEWLDAPGQRERKVVIEFEKADAASIGRAVTDSMVAARYRLTGSSLARGGERFNFRGDNGVRVSVLVRPRGAVKLQSSRSTGSIEFDYAEPTEDVAPVQDGSATPTQESADSAAGREAN